MLPKKPFTLPLNQSAMEVIPFHTPFTIFLPILDTVEIRAIAAFLKFLTRDLPAACPFLPISVTNFVTLAIVLDKSVRTLVGSCFINKITL